MSEIMVTGFLPGKFLCTLSLGLDDKPFPKIDKDGFPLEIRFDGEEGREFPSPKKDKVDLSPACEDGKDKTNSGSVLNEEIELEAM
jgi:hypothetical protein